NVEVESEVSKLIRHQRVEVGVVTRYLRARSGRPNLIAVDGPQRARKSLLLVGHMDTASLGNKMTPAPFSGLVRNNRMYGLGVLDMKASLSAYIFAVKALKDMGVKFEGKLKLAFTADGMAHNPSK